LKDSFGMACLTALEAFPRLILPCPQSVPHATLRLHSVIACGAVASGISPQPFRAVNHPTRW